jgi:hypothetical protein
VWEKKNNILKPGNTTSLRQNAMRINGGFFTWLLAGDLDIRLHMHTIANLMLRVNNPNVLLEPCKSQPSSKA